MTSELSNFAARLREAILSEGRLPRNPDLKDQNGGSWNSPLRDFNRLALELFALQLKHNPAYRKICAGRKLMPGAIEHWTEVPPVPTAVFKELELTSIPPAERTAVFHSSGTTEQKPSRHFHNVESLAVYEASLWTWFEFHLFRSADSLSASSRKPGQAVRAPLVILTPPPEQVPHSSLVHMFETIRQKLGGASVLASPTVFFGKITSDGSWTLDFDAVVKVFSSGGDETSPPPWTPEARPLLILGTAFSFVHLLDHLAENDLRFQLPAGSRVMETGGYKNRSRSLPKAELHQLITERLGIPPENILCEYGMSELSSQAYDGTIQLNDLPHPGPLPKERENCRQSAGESVVFGNSKRAVKTRHFQFPPWARVQIISPETGLEVAEGETGLIRIFDLANVFSVMAIQTEDLGIRRGEQFELIGRAALAEDRGCSLMTV